MKKNIAIIIGIVIIGGISFYGGMRYGQNKVQTANQARLQQRGVRNGSGIGGGFASGDIISKDDKSVTINLKDGGSKIIFYSSSTPIMKSAGGSVNDLVVGKQITVNGTANQDGSISAQSIQIRPESSLLQKQN